MIKILKNYCSYNIIIISYLSSNLAPMMPNEGYVENIYKRQEGQFSAQQSPLLKASIMQHDCTNIQKIYTQMASYIG